MNIFRKCISLILIFKAIIFADYKSTNLSIDISRNSIANIYKRADSSQKIKIIQQSRSLLIEYINNTIFPHWYYTPWSFYGNTTTPRSGSIACGYFVTIVLVDVGFYIPRIKWAQYASEIWIKKFCNEIQRFSNRPISEVIDYIKKKPDGIYIVGLDCHIGFIVKYKERIQFVHSNYYQPSIGVMSENLDTENPLRDSKYRVIGTLPMN